MAIKFKRVAYDNGAKYVQITQDERGTHRYACSNNWSFLPDADNDQILIRSLGDDLTLKYKISEITQPLFTDAEDLADKLCGLFFLNAGGVGDDGSVARLSFGFQATTRAGNGNYNVASNYFPFNILIPPLSGYTHAKVAFNAYKTNANGDFDFAVLQNQANGNYENLPAEVVPNAFPGALAGSTVSTVVSGAFPILDGYFYAVSCKRNSGTASLVGTAATMLLYNFDPDA